MINRSGQDRQDRYNRKLERHNRKFRRENNTDRTGYDREDMTELNRTERTE